jgi:hypothetical protein
MLRISIVRLVPSRGDDEPQGVNHACGASEHEDVRRPLVAGNRVRLQAVVSPADVRQAERKGERPAREAVSSYGPPLHPPSV